MIDTRALELIHGAIDGTHSTSDANEFDRLMKSSEEARAMYASLAKLNGILDETPQLDVPAGLRAQILTAVEYSRPARGASAMSPVTPFRSKVAGTPQRTVRGGRKFGSWPGYAAAAAAGLLLGVLGLTWISEISDLDPADTMATMAPRSADSVLPENADPIETAEVDAPNRLGAALELEAAQIGVGSDGDEHVVQVSGDTRDWRSVTLTYDPLQLQFEGLASSALASLSADTSIAGQARIVISEPAEFNVMFSYASPGAAGEELNAEIGFSVELADGSATHGALFLAR